MPAKARKKKKWAKEKNVNTAVIYTRVSTEEQVKGYSLDSQQERCLEYAEADELKVQKVFREEGRSGRTMNRPMWNELMEFCRKNPSDVGYLIVDRIDRIGRNEQEAAMSLYELDGIGLRVRSVSEPVIDETPIGRYMRTMQLAYAQLDSDIRTERTEIGMRYGLKNGFWQWRPPVGYQTDYSRDDETLPMKPNINAKYVSRSFQLMATGNYSINEVFEMVSEEGFSISRSQFNRMLTNRIYAGWIEYEPWFDEPVFGKHEPLISDDTFHAVQRVLDARKKGTRQYRRVRTDLPLRGVLVCSPCNKKMTGGYSKSRGKPFGYYHCAGGGCQSIPVKKAEDLFLKELRRLEPKDKYLEIFIEVAKDVFKERKASSKEVAKRLERELKRLQKKKDSLLDKHIEGSVDAEDYRVANKRIRDDIEDKQAALDRVRREEGEIDEFVKYVVDGLKDLSNFWKKADIRVKMRLNDLIFPNGVLVEGKTIRITDTSLVLDLLSPKKATRLRMVPPAEFESASPP